MNVSFAIKIISLTIYNDPIELKFFVYISVLVFVLVSLQWIENVSLFSLLYFVDSILYYWELVRLFTFFLFYFRFVEVAPEFVKIASVYFERFVEILRRTIHKLNHTGLFLASKTFGPLSISVHMYGTCKYTIATNVCIPD